MSTGVRRFLALLLGAVFLATIPVSCKPDVDPSAGATGEASASPVTPEGTSNPSPNAPDPSPTEPIPTPEVLMPFADTMTAAEIARDMGAGWNLGNTLDAGGADPMPISPLAQETAWGNPVTTSEMIGLLKDTGFSTLRIPVTWQRHIGPAPDYLIEKEFMNRVQEVVDYGIEREMYVILNLHHEDWCFPSTDNTEAAPKLTAVWRQIAARFAGYSEKLIFEAMNEPRMKGTPEEWTGGNAEARSVINSWNYTIIRTIRETGFNNEKRFLMIPTIAASSDAAALKDFYVPKDKNVIVSIHAYIPYDMVLSTSNARNTFDPAKSTDTADINAFFKRLDDRFLSQGVTVVIGETGCLNKSENAQSRAAWADYYTQMAVQRGIPCVWWDNGVRTGTGKTEAFGLMNRKEVSWWYPEIAEAFVKNYRSAESAG